MKNAILGFILFVMVNVIIGCDQSDNNPEFDDQPVVEAYLRNGDSINVKISREVPFAEDYSLSDDDINNLTVNVKYNDSFYRLASAGGGVYMNNNLRVKEGELYELLFEFNGKSVTAYTTIPSKPKNFAQSASSLEIEQPSGGPPSSMPAPLELTWDNPDASYYLVVVENMEKNPTAIREFDTGSPPPNRFRNQPIQTNKYDIQSMSFWYYGTYRLILFHLNPDYASLYDQKGTSSQNLSNPSTGIQNGLGIFTGINSDTLYLEVTK
jgi:hypothetical protein